MKSNTHLLGILALLVAVSLGIAAEPQDKAPAKEIAGGRIDLEKLKQLKERMAASKVDVSALKKITWKIGDATREALVYVPAKQSGKKPPLVFAFHGHGGTSGFAARQFALHELWPEAVCVYPQGLPASGQIVDKEGKLPGWQNFIGDLDDRDLKFFDKMLATMKADHDIDVNRVYSTGHSHGGYFTYELWAARGDELAAVAPIGAVLDIRDFKKQKPLPVLHVAGEKDPLVKFRGQQLTMERDRKLNGCDPEGKASGKYCTEYSSKNGPPVVTFIHPGGHEIPSGAPERIVQFFKEHTRKEPGGKAK